jgi:hypothetical protein
MLAWLKFTPAARPPPPPCLASQDPNLVKDCHPSLAGREAASAARSSAAAAAAAAAAACVRDQESDEVGGLARHKAHLSKKQNLSTTSELAVG